QVFLARAFLVAADDPLVEVVDVEDRQLDGEIAAVDECAVAVIVVRVALVGLVHREGFFDRCHFFVLIVNSPWLRAWWILFCRRPAEDRRRVVGLEGMLARYAWPLLPNMISRLISCISL